jgi:hypothetical protein
MTDLVISPFVATRAKHQVLSRAVDINARASWELFFPASIIFQI